MESIEALNTAVHTTRQPRKIRYSDAEWDAIVQRAHACGQPPASYVRAVSLGAQPKAARSQANASVIHELGRIGNALAVLTSQERAGTADERADAIDAVLGELLAVVRRLA